MKPKQSYTELLAQERAEYDEATREWKDTTLFRKYDKLINEGLKDDEWAIDALAYEIGNHDFMYDEDNQDALAVFGLPGASRLTDPRWKMIHKKAVDRALGIEDIEETSENSYYLLVRRTDPTYRAEDAIKEWLSENSDVAVGLGRQYWSENDPDSEPFDWDTFEEIINSLGAWEAFQRGLYSNINWSDDYVAVDGYGNFESMSDYEVEKKCLELTGDSYFIKSILEGDLEIPPDMAEILTIFGVDEDDLAVSFCKRSKHAVTSKNRKKHKSKKVKGNFFTRIKSKIARKG